MSGGKPVSPWIMKRVLQTDMVKHATVWKQPQAYKGETTT